jgi:hypothetical protein
MVTVQVLAVPLQAPLHPENIELEKGEAVKVTFVPFLKVFPLGLLDTFPWPSPFLETERAYPSAEVLAEKVADMVWLAVTAEKV